MQRVALVTGASRGIGKCTALALAKRGYNVAITARTLREGEGVFERSSTVHESRRMALPGSLETTATEIRARGREALPLRLDLLEPESIDAALSELHSKWGAVDVLVNNAVYQGPGNMDRVMDLTPELIERIHRANVVAPLRLVRALLPGMLERGGGVVVNVVSAAGLSDPPAPAGKGGWGFGYAASKAALGRLAGVLRVELEGTGVRVHNLEPGLVITELMKATGLDEALRAYAPSPPEVPAAVIAWLATEPGAEDWNGKTVSSTPFAREHGLWPKDL